MKLRLKQIPRSTSSKTAPSLLAVSFTLDGICKRRLMLRMATPYSFRAKAPDRFKPTSRLKKSSRPSAMNQVRYGRERVMAAKCTQGTACVGATTQAEVEKNLLPKWENRFSQKEK